MELVFALLARDGSPVHETRLQLGAYPAQALAGLSAGLYCADEALRGSLEAQGAQIVRELEQADVAFTVGEPAARELAFARNGGALVVVLSAAGDYELGDGRLTVVAREGVLSGDWATNNNWINTNVFSSLPSDGVLSFECEGIAGDLLIRPTQEATSLAGLVVGWAHSGGSYCTTMPVGGGSITATTVPLNRMDDAAPVASFVGDLVRHAGG
jgi:hypothetical protein